jgi:hypothetical protein
MKNSAMENHDTTPAATTAHQDMAKDASTTTSTLQTATGNPKEKVTARAKATKAKVTTKAGKRARKVGEVEVAVAKTIVAAEATGGS